MLSERVVYGLRLPSILPAKARLLVCLLGIWVVAAMPCFGGIFYSTGFESGTLGPEWSATSELPGGRVEVLPAFIGGSFGDAIPHTGDYFLGMDYETGGAYQTNEAWLSLNLTGQSNVILEFWWMEWNDENEAEDGIYLSDDGGANFVKVYSLLGEDFQDLTWQFISLDISTLAASNSLTIGPSFVIKFQQRDNYYFDGGNDGFFFDDITVSSDGGEIPEPSTAWLLSSVGLLALAGRMRHARVKRG